jgi:hypothetical protein
MREGHVLLVDDGSCPAGQIKRVVGGNHTKEGGTKQMYQQAVASRARLTSAHGPSETCRLRAKTSEFSGKAENICSH